MIYQLCHLTGQRWLPTFRSPNLRVTTCMVLLSVQKDAVVLGLEPLHAILLLQLVGCAHLAHLQLAILHAAARPRKVHIEVHAVDACARVVLDPQVNVLLGHTILLSCGQVHGSRMTPANGLHKQREREKEIHIKEVKCLQATQDSPSKVSDQDSVMPKPKLPFLAKFFFRSSYSFTFRPFSKISSISS